MSTNTTITKGEVATSSTNQLVSTGVTNEIKSEINAMLSFALNNGLAINNEVNSLLESTKINDLLTVHALLIKDVLPATPKSIQYLNIINQEGIQENSYSKVPLVRNLILLALFFLTAFVTTALFPEVNNDSLDKGIMDNNGLSLLLNLTFLCSISGLGVAFYLLKSVSTAIQKGTLVPEDAIYYTALIFLGIIAGIILSEIISLYTTDNGINLFNKSILALIGGFSSDAIFSVLQSLIAKIKQLFSTSN
ncbi:hypothetical protein [Pseudofulvibacter geojedonensis]|uniref:MotA/TolQ/ExbB proton channel domain-containing protein n=1 Tax=Pseudofulvibacter geojedonensis TaxID=1123758 RepID=A0ABW3I3N3_9FLAO